MTKTKVIVIGALLVLCCAVLIYAQGPANDALITRLITLEQEVAHLKEASQAGVPRGTIVAWYSKSGKVPAGWQLCNGSNGTPDLTRRFLIGVTNPSEVGQDVGFESHTHSASGEISNANAYGPPLGPFPKNGLVERIGAIGPFDHSHRLNIFIQPSPSIPPSAAVLYIMKL